MISPSMDRKPASTRTSGDSCSAQYNSEQHRLHASFVNHCGKSWKLQETQHSGKPDSYRRGLQV